MRVRTAKMRGRIRTRPEGVLLDTHAWHASMHSQPHAFSAKQVSAHRQTNFVFLSSRAVFRGCSCSAEPRKMRAVAQKLRRARRHMFFCALAGGFWVRPFLKSTSTDFGGGGLVGAGGLGAALRSLVSPQSCTTSYLLCFPNLHAAVWPRNPDHKLTRSAAARLLSTHSHTHTHSSFGVCVV